MPLNQTFPTWTSLNQANSSSSSGQTDLRTGVALQGGNLVPGDYFDLTEAEANALSYTTTGTLHAGRYRWVLVDSAATAANVKTGTVGLLRSLALGPNVVTSYDQGLGGGVTAGVSRAVVFLNSVTPGNYGFVQEAGDANVLFNGTASGGAGTPVYAASSGLGTSSSTSAIKLGGAEATLSVSVLNRVILDLPLIQG
jgi:hypothetical protein